MADKLLSNVLGFARATPVISSSKQIYIALRADGKAGTGSIVDPFDGSTSSKIDAIVRAAPLYAQINLGPGIFTTVGVNSDAANSPVGILLREGQILRGCGIGITTIKMAYTPGSANKCGVFTDPGAHYCKVEDLTIDADWAVNFAVGYKVSCVIIQGSHAVIRRVNAKNFGGDRASGAECFPVAILNVADGDALVEGCVVTNLIPGGTNTLGYASCIWVDGYGAIKDCYVNAHDGFGVVGGATHNRRLLVENCTFEDLACGIYGDTWSGGRLIVRDCYFRNPARGIQLEFGSGEGLDLFEATGCLFEMGARSAGITGGTSIRISAPPDGKVKLISIANNKFLQAPGDSVSPGEGCWSIHGVDVLCYVNNIMHRNYTRTAAAYFDSTIIALFAYGNTYENGEHDIQANNSIVNPEINVVSTADPLICGNALKLAMSYANFSWNPNNSPKSSTNIVTVRLGSGKYTLPDSITTCPENVRIVGSGVEETIFNIQNGFATQGGNGGFSMQDLMVIMTPGGAFLRDDAGTGNPNGYLRNVWLNFGAGDFYFYGNSPLKMSFYNVKTNFPPGDSTMTFFGTIEDCDMPSIPWTFDSTAKRYDRRVAGQQYFLRLNADVSSASLSNVNSPQNIILPPGKYMVKARMTGVTNSTTGGIQLSAVMSAANDTMSSGSIVITASDNGVPNSSSRTVRTGSSVAQFLLGSACDAPSKITEGVSDFAMTLSAQTTFTPAVKQRSAADNANPATLLAGSYLEFLKIA